MNAKMHEWLNEKIKMNKKAKARTKSKLPAAGSKK